MTTEPTSTKARKGAATRKNATPENATPPNATRRQPGKRAREEAAARWDANKARLLTVARSRSEDKLAEAVPTFARLLGWSEHNTRTTLIALSAQVRMDQESLAQATSRLLERVCRPIGDPDDSGAIQLAEISPASPETA